MFILRVSAHLLQNRQDCHLSNEHLNLPLQKQILKFLRKINLCVWIPLLQDRHLKIMKDMKFETLQISIWSIGSVQWMSLPLINAAAITGDKSRCLIPKRQNTHTHTHTHQLSEARRPRGGNPP